MAGRRSGGCSGTCAWSLWSALGCSTRAPRSCSCRRPWRGRGPVYPPVFNSLSFVATTAVDAVVLVTDFCLDGVLGAALVVVGLYAFLWGKTKELAAAAKGDNGEQELRRGDADDRIATASSMELEIVI
ncbi:hypothetical protein CFC21_110972 [Triticum aestivum]|uniref:WAT1-related protein n=3 Tax=Triticinae TaxID=1648030 RepID=A0A3B6TKC3_WHEAT|nr:hypothetical protein CFC21_110972 [Triticum aestivum]